MCCCQTTLIQYPSMFLVQISISIYVPGTHLNVHLSSWYNHQRPFLVQIYRPAGPRCQTQRRRCIYCCRTTLPQRPSAFLVQISMSIYFPGTHINVHQLSWYNDPRPSTFLKQISRPAVPRCQSQRRRCRYCCRTTLIHVHLRSWYKSQCPSTFLVHSSKSIYVPGTIINVHLFSWYKSADLLYNVAELSGEDVYAAVERPHQNVHLLSWYKS